MKSQDIILLFKISSLHVQEEEGRLEWKPTSAELESYLRVKQGGSPASVKIMENPGSGERYADWGLFGSVAPGGPESDFDGWEGWNDIDLAPEPEVASFAQLCSLRSLSSSLGLSKSEVSNALVRCREAGLLTNDFDTGLPKVNRRALLGIAENALKYFFPVKLGAIVRGVPTGFAAPALSKHLKSAGDLIPVWPDPLGKEKGQALEPLYKSVPGAVKKDRNLYHYLALVDAIRVGGPRESAVAADLLRVGMGL